MKLWALLDVACLILGATAVIVGVAQVYAPAGWIAAGAALIAFSLMPPRRA